MGMHYESIVLQGLEKGATKLSSLKNIKFQFDSEESAIYFVVKS